MTLSRRDLLGAATLMGLGAAPNLAGAQFRVDISGVGGTQLPIAIPDFRDEAAHGVPVAAILRDDLARSGLFRLVDAGAPLDETSAPDFGALRSRPADALAAGTLVKLSSGGYELRYRVWEVVKGSVLIQTSLSSAASPGSVRMLAHTAADAIIEALTGARGPFASRIAYVTRAGSRHTLWVAHSDGESAQEVLSRNQPIISPAWAPDGKALAYVSFERGKAEVFVRNLESSAPHQSVAAFRGSNSAPAWSPNGQQLAVTLSRDGGSQLYVIGRAGGEPRRLTSSSAIDTEAVWTPDGKSLYFVSDRGGAPQIYRIGAAGEGSERVSFDGSYNISPAISPDGKLLAYVTRAGGDFKLQLLDLARASVSPLTDTQEDESPSFAPNGKLILYATRVRGRDTLMTATLDGKVRMPLAVNRGEIREPAWGPYV